MENKTFTLNGNIIIQSDSKEFILSEYKKLLKCKDVWLFIEIHYNENTILIKQFNKYIQKMVANNLIGLHGDFDTQKTMLKALESELNSID